MLILKLALRNIFRNKKRTIFTVLTMVIGFVLSALTLSVQTGSYDGLISKFTEDTTGHIQVFEKDYLDSPSIYKTIDNKLNIKKLIKKNINIKNIYAEISAGGLIFSNSSPIPIIIRGLSKEKINLVKNNLYYKKTNKKYKNENSIILTQRAVINLNVKLGDDVYLISQGLDGSSANDKFKLIGIIENEKKMNIAYMNLDTASNFFSLQGKVHKYIITIDNYNNSVKVSKQINKLLKENKINNYISSPWQVIEKEFYDSMEKDKKGDSSVFYIIMLVVAMGVLNTILMSILERKKEFGVLKAIGTRGKFIFLMILLEVILISIISIIVASIIFSLINIYFVTVGITFPEPMSIGNFFMEKIKGAYTMKIYIIPSLIVLLSSIVVSIYPAFKASKRKAIESFR